MWSAAVLSLLLHGVFGWVAHDQPLGSVDLNLILDQRPPIRIRRAPADRVIDRDWADRTDRDSQAQLSAQLKQLAKNLLANTSVPRPPAAGPDIPVHLRPSPGHPPGLDGHTADDPQANLSGMRQADKLVNAIALADTHPPITTGTGSSTASGAGQPDRSYRLPPQATARYADLLLRKHEIQPIARVQPPPTDQPHLVPRPVLDRQPTQAPPRTPPLDVASTVFIPTANLAPARHLDHDFEYHVTTYQPTQEKGGFLWWGNAPSDKRGYVRIDIAAKRSLHRLRTLPKDVVFLIDTSESVSQLWVDQVVRGVGGALDSLNPDDRFNIVFFSDSPKLLSTESIQPANPNTIAAAHRFLTSARSAGHTDVNRALSTLLVRDVAIERVYDLVLISDGRPTRGVRDTRELINRITRDNDLAAGIYCVGIGDRPNRQMLEFLAYRNKGYCVFAEHESDAAQVIRDLLSRLRYPIIKNLSLIGLGLDRQETYPRDLPTLHQGQPLSVYARYDQPSVFTMRLVGLNGTQPLDFSFTRDLNDAQAGNESIAKQWAFWKLHHLYNQVFSQADDRAIRRQIDQLRKRYGLKTVY